MLFTALAVVCAAVGIFYVLHANERTADEERNAKKVSIAGPAALARYAREPHVMFRNTALGERYGKVALVPRGDLTAPRAVSDLTCERVDFAGGRGVCLQADRGVVTTYHGAVFDRRFEILREFALAGAPSRVRVSPDGRWAGITVFVTGHSYADLNFSTATSILDLRTGELLPDLEQFTVRNDGTVVDSIDRNYWGVTFKPNSDGFYATLQTGGRIYLIEGDVSSRTAKVIGDDVECPSLSPDGKKIAFKVRERRRRDRRASAGTSPCSIWHPGGGGTCPSAAASTTRWPGRATTRWSTAFPGLRPGAPRPTCGRSRPTGRASRAVGSPAGGRRRSWRDRGVTRWTPQIVAVVALGDVTGDGSPRFC